ncbi:ketopantoate reductase family protein [Paenibacillus thalictri]|uniref:2-dehydropantoate 2-reductase n=1 Tax=Paenibacillus thalictri TaxID=2527873 RepID=A0A4Q9DGH1_9BACL|nr:2-dehydropantoate 2-reductase [Paenibacillus thalictri]TBL70298.1 2-dehydropantoate 2-reductase [Paenibacillus thalictri]
MIAIIGAGAMGGMLAAKLSAAGKKVVLVDVSASLVEQIQGQGLVVDTKNIGTETYRIEAATEPGGLGQAEAVFFFVKAQHTASAAELAKPLVGPDTTVVSLQNGWGNADVLAEVFPSEQIVVGVTYHSATVVGLGHVAHTGFGATYVGPYIDGASLQKAEEIGGWLGASDMDVTVTPQVKTEIWKKLILNAVTLPTSALTGLCAGAQGEEGDLLELLDAITAESVAVARAQGYDITLEERVDRIHTILNNAGKGKSSMLQDAEARRKTEIEVINGAVVKAAKKAGVPVPLNTAMVALIHGMERGWRQ